MKEISSFATQVAKYLSQLVDNDVWLTFVVYIVALILFDVIVFFVLQFVFRKIYQVFKKRTKEKLNTEIVRDGIIKYFSKLIPLVVISEIVPVWFKKYPAGLVFMDKLVEIMIVVVLLNFVRNIFGTFKDYLSTKEGAKDKPLDSYFQVLSLIIYILAGFIILSILTGVNTWKYISGLGAASAVLLLVFKDTILGFVASLQVSINDMVRVGDWIEMPKYNADGFVTEISLNTVKIQNWDMTISTIPTHYLVTESVKNWRGMQETGGRRMKRAINIASDSIKHLHHEDIEKLCKIKLLAPFMERLKAKLLEDDESKAINEVYPTNLGLFRVFIEQYLKSHKEIRQDLLLIVRHLHPTEKGLPLEVYAFANSIALVDYERITSEVFEHIFASIDYFDLRILEIRSVTPS